MIVGIGFAIERRASVGRFPTTGIGIAIVLGRSVLDQFLSLFLKADGSNSGGRQIHGMFGDPRFNILTTSSSVGTQFPHAVGIALALRTLGLPGVAWVFGGDGAATES